MKNTGYARMRVLGYLLTIIVFLGLAPTIAFAAPPSAFDMFKEPRFSMAELSPSGRYLALVRSETKRVCLDSYDRVKKDKPEKCRENRKEYRAKYFILVIDIEGVEDTTVFPMPDDLYVRWFEWANEDRLLAAFARRFTMNDRGTRFAFGGSRVMAMDRDGGNVVVLFDDEAGIERSNNNLTQVVNLLRDDPDHILMPATKNRVYDLFKVNVLTGAAEQITNGTKDTFQWYTDRQGKPIIRFDRNYKGSRIDVFAWSDETQAWEKIRTIRTSRRNNEEVFEFTPVAPTGVSNQIYVISDEEDDPRRAVKIFDLKENRYIETVFEHEKYDVGGVVRSLVTGDYAGVWYFEDRLRYELTDPDLQKHMDSLNKFFDFKENVNLLGFTKDGTKAVLYVSGPQNPGAYYLYDFSGRKIELLFTMRPDIAANQLGATEILDVPMRDGTTIRGYLTHPAGGANPAAALIMMPHGGPEVRDIQGYDAWAQFLASRGYQVLQVNFRGSSGYGRAFAEAGYGQWGGLMQDDVTDAVKYLHETGRAPANRTCIFGYSYGGYVALMGGIKTPELYQCIIAGAAPTDLVWDLQEILRYFGSDSSALEYWQKSIGVLQTERAHIKSISPVNHADKLRVPVLLAHGNLDGIVNIKHAERMVRAMKRAKVDFEFIELKGDGHTGWDLDNEILFFEAVESFLAEHLPVHTTQSGEISSAQGE